MSNLIPKIELNAPQEEEFNYLKVFNSCLVDLSEELMLPPTALGIGYHDYKGSSYLNNTFSYGEFSAIVAASDVLLNPAKSEGFGLPIVEAQACGTPVITNHHSAMPEVTRLGWCLKPLQPEYNPLGQWFSVASIEDIAAALEDIYQNPPSEQRRMQASYDLIAEYNWQNVLRQWQEKVLSPLAEMKMPAKEVAYAD